MKAEALRLDSLTAAEIDAWRALSDAALEPNAFLSPDFVLPAVRWLTPRAAPILLRCRNLSGGVTGLGLFERVEPNGQLPLPHIRAYCSPHTYLTGVLLDRRRASAALQTLLASLRDLGYQHLAVEMARFPADSAFADLFDHTVDALGLPWFELGRQHRAALVPADCTSETLALAWPPRRHKEMRRRLRRLEELGRVEHRMVWAAADDERPVEDFLRLEHSGWKGNAGTSLLSSPAHTAFFREMIQNFARRGRAVFSELCLDGRVIATSCNLVAGDHGFAFKIAHDPRFAQVSPGQLHEELFVQRAAEHFSSLSLFDSCASPGSFVEPIWFHRRAVRNGLVSTSGLATTFGIVRKLAVDAYRSEPVAEIRAALARTFARRPDPPGPKAAR